MNSLRPRTWALGTVAALALVSTSTAAATAAGIPPGRFDGIAVRTPSCMGPQGATRNVTDCWTGRVDGRPFVLKVFRNPDSQGYTVTIGGHTTSSATGPVTFYRFSGTYACFMTQAGAFAAGVDLLDPRQVIEPLSRSARRFDAVCGGSLPALNLGYVTGVPGRFPLLSGDAKLGVAHAASDLPPVLAQAMGDVYDASPRLPLGAPTVLPPEPPSHLYLTAQTAASATAWTVHVLRLARPLGVNNPAIGRLATAASAVAGFGVSRRTGREPAVGSPGLPSYLWQQDLTAIGVGPDAFGPLLTADGQARSTSLGLGITAVLEPTGTPGSGVYSLEWHEGDWTLVVRDTSRATALAIGRQVVRYLHRAYMPPHPGLVMVGIGVHGVYTRIAWTEGSYLYHIDNDLAYGANPVAACEMAVDWQAIVAG